MTNTTHHIIDLHTQITNGNNNPHARNELHTFVTKEINGNPNWNTIDKTFKTIAFDCIKHEAENDVTGLHGTSVMDAFLDWKTEHPLH